ncbi:sensor histidine kinase [Streptomyces sp. 5.8]|uniref:sensor histidine kinase n=1 Tax=Streptomyces sp. 5.8 TaxID=3406571 RepID=UPI003BB54409
MDATRLPATGRLGRHGAALLTGAAFLALWLLDLLTARPYGVPLLLAAGAAVALVALLPAPRGRRVPVEGRAAAAVLLSGATTLFLALRGGTVGFGMGEVLVLLTLLTRTARRGRAGPLALGLCLLLAAAVATAPLRMGHASERTSLAFLLTLAAGGAAALGWYLRTLDERRTWAVGEVRERERLRLARDLHDFVAHHVTGMVVQAQAARIVRESSPEQLDPLLRSIEAAGNETLDSMHRLVRVLREDGAATVRPGDLLAELGLLVARSGRDGHGPAARLTVSARARTAVLDPEVETTVHRVVQESLTNVGRHAPDAATVEVEVDAEEAESGAAGVLRVTVSNGPGASARPPLIGRRGGFGLIGLRERVEAVGGALRAGPLPTGGWRLTATLPVRGRT